MKFTTPDTASAPYTDGVFDAVTHGWSIDFSHGWLHTVWILTVSGGTPSFKGDIYGRIRQAKPGTTPGSNTPTYVDWTSITPGCLGINAGITVSNANTPNCLASSTKLIWSEVVQVNGMGRQYYPRVTAIGGTNPTLDVWMAFSRG
jgi:hypothetical protein